MSAAEAASAPAGARARRRRAAPSARHVERERRAEHRRGALDRRRQRVVAVTRIGEQHVVEHDARPGLGDRGRAARRGDPSATASRRSTPSVSRSIATTTTSSAVARPGWSRSSHWFCTPSNRSVSRPATATAPTASPIEAVASSRRRAAITATAGRDRAAGVSAGAHRSVVSARSPEGRAANGPPARRRCGRMRHPVLAPVPSSVEVSPVYTPPSSSHGMPSGSFTDTRW